MNAAPDRGPLAALLAQMVQAALGHPGARQKSRRLAGGLYVELYVTPGEAPEVHLALYRLGTWPSAAEWRAVITRLPLAVPAVLPAPAQSEHTDRHILSAAWPLPRPESETVAIADLPDYLRQNGLRAVGLDWSSDGEPPTLRTEPDT